MKILKKLSVDLLFQDGFPKGLSEDVSKVVKLIPLKTYCNVSIGTSEEAIQYFQNKIEIRFPYRMYYIDVSDDDLNNLGFQQRMILHCIYTRSYDGFVRQKHLKSLLLMNYPNWAIPYIVKVCDEYVIEILEMVYDILKKQDTEPIKQFCLENVQSFCKSYARMTSYWNEFYRYRCYNFHKYVGRKLFRECFGYYRGMERIE